MATVTKTGVKWIKVSKTDALGNSYNNSWRLNKSITLNYSDIGPTKYNITTITEYSNYWLLGLDYANVTSSVQGAKNYKVVASNNSIYDFNNGASSSITNYNEITDASSLFNAAGGVFQSLNQTNIPLVYSASVTFTFDNSSRAYPMVSFVENPSETATIIKKTSILNPGSSPYTITISGSFIPNPSSNYGLIIGQDYNASALQVYIQTGDITFTITQSVAPSVNTITNLDPFITTPFEGTDCDVTYGWIQSYPNSQYFMDIDYSTGAIIPTNQIQLVSGTATPAPVKDYYYNSNRQIIPRYKGSRPHALKYNEYSGPIDNVNIGTEYNTFPDQTYQGDVSYGRTSTIDQYKSYAAKFQYIAGYGPEMYNALLAYVTDIIDENGNVQQPKLDDASYYNLVDSFGQNENATVKLLDNQGLTQFASLNNTFNIIRSGKRIDTPLFTYTASISGSTSIEPLEGIAFQGINNTTLKILQNYSSSWEFQTDTLIQTSTVALNSASLQTRTNSRFLNSNGYKLLSGDNAANANSPLTFRCSILTRGSVNSGTYRVQLVKSTSPLEGYPTPVTTPYTTIYDFGYRVYTYSTVTLPIEDILNFEVKGVNVEEGYYYNFLVSEGTQGGFFRISKYYVSVDQDIPYNTSATYNVTYAGDKYLLTSSTDLSILTASNTLVGYYGSTQTDLVKSGFNQPIPFTIQTGDEIRFVGDETKTHLIYNVNYGGNFLTFNINPPLPTSSYDIRIVNSFSIRRYTDDPNIVILAGTKPAGGTPSGIIKPQYTTDKLKNVIQNNPLFTLQSGQSS